MSEFEKDKYFNLPDENEEDLTNRKEVEVSSVAENTVEQESKSVEEKVIERTEISADEKVTEPEAGPAITDEVQSEETGWENPICHSEENTFSESCEPRKTINVKIKKRNGIKRYVAIIVVAALVNVTALCGFFALGFKFGVVSKVDEAKKLEQEKEKEKVIATLQAVGSSDSREATPVVRTGNELTTVEISKKVGPAVVGIISTTEGQIGFFGMPSTAEGSGSGIIIDKAGYIVTNDHVISGATTIKVALNTGSEYEAKLIGTDPRTDLAVIKIEPDEELTVAELGDSSKVEVGERAIAIGNPLGMEFFGSTTQGIISAINRSVTVDNKTLNLIQTDAAINQGNSGGALVDAYGKVIGINAVKISSSTVEGMGFAIPITEASPIIQDLIEHGYVKGRPVIGISIRDVTEYMSKRQDWPVGVQVMAVIEGSGAEIAGLEQGDIITKVDGKEVKTSDELNKIKDTHKPGEHLNMEVYKYETGLTEEVKVKLTEEKPE